jgi:hypothetical protein
MTLSTKSSPKSVARVSGGKKEVLWHYELGVKYNEHSQQYTAVGSDSCECLSIVDTSALAALRDDAAKAMQAALADMRAGKQEATKRQATGLKEQAVRDAKAI